MSRELTAEDKDAMIAAMQRVLKERGFRKGYISAVVVLVEDATPTSDRIHVGQFGLSDEGATDALENAIKVTRSEASGRLVVH